MACAIMYFIHYGFNKSDAEATFSFIMNEVVNFWFMKAIDIKHDSIVHDFKDECGFFLDLDVQLKMVVRIALMRVDDKVRTHLIQR